VWEPKVKEERISRFFFLRRASTWIAALKSGADGFFHKSKSGDIAPSSQERGDSSNDEETRGAVESLFFTRGRSVPP